MAVKYPLPNCRGRPIATNRSTLVFVQTLHVGRWRYMNPWEIVVPAAIAVAGGYSYGAVHPRAQIFGVNVHHTNSPRQLAITFDDGPNPAITPKLLQLLELHK